MGQRISQLDLAGPLSGSEYFAVVQEGKTKKVQAASFTPLFTGGCQCTLVSRGESVPAPDVAFQEYLQSFQLKPNTLRAIGDWIEVISFGSFAVNTNVKNIFHQLHDLFHDISSSGSINETSWTISTILTKISSSQVKAITTFNLNGSPTSDGKTGNRYGATTMLTTQQANISVGSYGLNAASDVIVEGFIIRLNQIDVNS